METAGRVPAFFFCLLAYNISERYRSSGYGKTRDTIFFSVSFKVAAP
jgi:hypothetical protein